MATLAVQQPLHRHQCTGVCVRARVRALFRALFAYARSQDRSRGKRSPGPVRSPRKCVTGSPLASTSLASTSLASTSASACADGRAEGRTIARARPSTQLRASVRGEASAQMRSLPFFKCSRVLEDREAESARDTARSTVTVRDNSLPDGGHATRDASIAESADTSETHGRSSAHTLRMPPASLYSVPILEDSAAEASRSTCGHAMAQSMAPAADATGSTAAVAVTVATATAAAAPGCSSTASTGRARSVLCSDAAAAPSQSMNRQRAAASVDIGRGNEGR
eukprot:5090423-Pleurochrysis_carterae.AAC.4